MPFLIPATCQPVVTGQKAFEPPKEQLNGSALFVDFAKSPDSDFF
jgi:hypothetical protein